MSDRLFLREINENDLDLLYQIFDEAVSMTFYTSQQKSEKAEIWLQHILDSYKINGFGMWLCFLRKNNRFIGQCGLLKNKVDAKLEIELGYSVLREYWNRGFASEAAKACIEFGFNNIETEQIISLIEKENIASQHVSKNIGMKKIDEVKRGEKLVDLYSIER